jgi:hypothetical protein
MVMFDVVVGNPPFNPTVNKMGKGNGSANKIWHKFVEKAFNELIKLDGCVLMVTPLKWRDGNFLKGSQHRKAQELIWSNAILWYEDVKKYFSTIGNSIGIDAWYVKVNGIKSQAQLQLQDFCIFPRDVANNNMMSIMGKFFKTCNKLTSFEIIGGNDQRKRICSKEKNEKCYFRHANTTAQTRKGQFIWYDYKSKGFNLKKVIASDCCALEPWYDDGQCGCGTHAFAYVVDDENEGKALIKFLLNPLINRLAAQVSEPGSLGFPAVLFKKIPKEVVNGLDCFEFTNEELCALNNV